MKKKILFITAYYLLSIISTTLTFSQSVELKFDSVLTYYPIDIGNKWVFDEYATSTIEPIITIHRVWSIEFVKDTLMPNNESYTALQKKYYDGTPAGGFKYERIDTVELKVLQYDPEVNSTNYEILILDLSIELFDTFYNPYCISTFQETGTTSRFGHTFNFRSYYSICGLFYPDFYYIKGLGLYRYAWYADFVESLSHLRGCIINGIVYGDTTVVSVDDEAQQPITFALSQNYPNPFNPTTTIRYTIADFGFTSLKVYDVLGNEIATLVNEEKPAGSYEVQFSAKGGSASGGDAYNLPSGIYFYRLTAGSYSATKKMLLLK